MVWQVQKQSDGTVLFIGESWEEADEVAKLLTRTRGYNHNLLIVVEVTEQELKGRVPIYGPGWWGRE